MIEVTKLDRIIPERLAANLSKEAVERSLADVADAARAEWIRLAGSTLKTSRQDYIAGIQSVEMSKTRAVITLVGSVPNLVENGMPGTDLHDTLLGPRVPVVARGDRGKHARKDGIGYYRAIPFRHATPTAGFTSGVPMGARYENHPKIEDAKKLGRDVYRAAKKLEPTRSDPYGPTRWGERMQKGLAPKLRERHAVDIYAGMVRLAKTYKKATQYHYMTFRTISTNSPGWYRPDTRPGAQLAQKVSRFVQRIASKTFQAYVNQVAAK